MQETYYVPTRFPIPTSGIHFRGAWHAIEVSVRWYRSLDDMADTQTAWRGPQNGLGILVLLVIWLQWPTFLSCSLVWPTLTRREGSDQLPISSSYKRNAISYNAVVYSQPWLTFDCHTNLVLLTTLASTCTVLLQLHEASACLHRHQAHACIGACMALA